MLLYRAFFVDNLMFLTHTNLILLENALNGEAGELDYQAKKNIYTRSRSAWVASFLSENPEWNSSKFEARSKQMAKDYYEKVFGKRVE